MVDVMLWRKRCKNEGGYEYFQTFLTYKGDKEREKYHRILFSKSMPSPSEKILPIKIPPISFLSNLVNAANS